MTWQVYKAFMRNFRKRYFKKVESWINKIITTCLKFLVQFFSSKSYVSIAESSRGDGGSCAPRHKVNCNRPHVHRSDKTNVVRSCVAFQFSSRITGSFVSAIRVNNSWIENIEDTRWRRVSGEQSWSNIFNNPRVFLHLR